MTAPAGFFRRLARVREEMRAAKLDAFVATHPPNVRYLTGFNGSAGLVLVTAADCVLVVDFRYAIAAKTLVERDADLLKAIRVVVPPESYDETLLRLLEESAARRIGIEAAHMSVSRFTRLSAGLAAAAPTPLEAATPCPCLVPTERLIERIRVIKDDREIATIREGARRIAAAAVEAAQFVRAGRSEVEIAGDIEALLRRSGFERPAFETIVASGPNSARPHARPGTRVLEQGDGVVLDFGGVYDGYCVDLSRTVQVGDGRPGFRRMFDAVVEAQLAAIALVRPGVRASEIDAAAREVLDVFARLREEEPDGPPHRIEHFGVASAQQMARARTLAAQVVTQPAFLRELGTNFRRWLPEGLLDRCYAFGAMRRAGLEVAFSSDGPVTSALAASAGRRRRSSAQKRSSGHSSSCSESGHCR